jgi:hypothetical protein
MEPLGEPPWPLALFLGELERRRLVLLDLSVALPVH